MDAFDVLSDFIQWSAVKIVDNYMGCIVKNKVEWKSFNGQLHRRQEPALILCGRNLDIILIQYWYKNGKKHRLTGPACESQYGYSIWFKNDVIHRDDGPAVIDTERGQQKWFRNGLCHRNNGPAIYDRYSALYYLYEFKFPNTWYGRIGYSICNRISLICQMLF